MFQLSEYFLHGLYSKLKCVVNSEIKSVHDTMSMRCVKSFYIYIWHWCRSAMWTPLYPGDTGWCMRSCDFQVGKVLYSLATAFRRLPKSPSTLSESSNAEESTFRFNVALEFKVMNAGRIGWICRTRTLLCGRLGVRLPGASNHWLTKFIFVPS